MKLGVWGKRKKGFSLSEIVVALVILAIVTALCLPSITGVINSCHIKYANEECSKITNVLTSWKSMRLETKTVDRCSDDLVDYMKNKTVTVNTNNTCTYYDYLVQYSGKGIVIASNVTSGRSARDLAICLLRVQGYKGVSQVGIGDYLVRTSGVDSARYLLNRKTGTVAAAMFNSSSSNTTNAGNCFVSLTDTTVSDNLGSLVKITPDSTVNLTPAPVEKRGYVDFDLTLEALNASVYDKEDFKENCLIVVKSKSNPSFLYHQVGTGASKNVFVKGSYTYNVTFRDAEIHCSKSTFEMLGSKVEVVCSCT